jgi:hypothetical protein
VTVELIDTRKVVVIGWDTDVVKGTHASIQAEGEEKRNVDNSGESNIFFPLDFRSRSSEGIKKGPRRGLTCQAAQPQAQGDQSRPESTK